MRPIHLTLAVALAMPTLVSSPETGLAQAAPGAGDRASALDPSLLYQGWRARPLIGQGVAARHDGRVIGAVRDLIIDADGRLAALVVEREGPARLTEFVHRIPWARVDLTPGRDGVEVDLARGGEQGLGLFPGSEAAAILPREFRLGEIVGDYARLKTGYGFGIVSDAVFTNDGRIMAVLVSRDAASGGGTVAFPFHGTAGPWDPGMSYYGLPFLAERDAQAAALSVDPNRFTAPMP